MSYRMAKALVFSKVRSDLGLDYCHFFISGAAPLNQETSEFFLSLDMPISEIYGMTECTGPHTVSNQNNYKIHRYQPPGKTPGPPATGGTRVKGGRMGEPRGKVNPDLRMTPVLQSPSSKSSLQEKPPFVQEPMDKGS